MKSYYELLEVDKNISPDMLKKVFKIQIKKYHPDLYEGDKIEAEEITKHLNIAYEVLSDPVKREIYDDEQNLLDEQNNIYQYDNINLTKENNRLKRELAKKEQIIEHFLGGLDLSEFENSISDEDKEYDNHENNIDNINEFSNVEKTEPEDYKKYYTNIFISFLAKIIALVLAVVLMVTFLSILKGENVLTSIANMFK